MRRSTIYIGMLTIAALAISAGCPPTQAPTGGENTDLDARLAVRSEDHVLVARGVSPSVTVIEYGDFQCPVCGRFDRETFPTIKANYIDTGKIRWVFRHFPLSRVHPDAQAAAEASECAADQGRFWAYHDKLFANQGDLARGPLREYAIDIGIDTNAFDPCSTRGSKTARVQTDVDAGTGLGVTATPTFFINGAKVSGFQSVAEFSARLDDALAGK